MWTEKFCKFMWSWDSLQVLDMSSITATKEPKLRKVQVNGTPQTNATGEILYPTKKPFSFHGSLRPEWLGRISIPERGNALPFQSMHLISSAYFSFIFHLYPHTFAYL